MPALLQIFLNIILSPGQAFTHLIEKASWKDWLYPLLIFTVIIISLPFTYRDIRLNEAEDQLYAQIDKIEARTDISDEQMAAISARMEKALDQVDNSRDNPFALETSWGYFLVPVMLLISASLFALILMMIGNFGLGGKLKFTQLLSLVILSYIIAGDGSLLGMREGVGIIELFVKLPLILAKEGTDVSLGIGLLMDKSDSFLYYFLMKLDVLRMWSIAIVGIGFAQLYKKTPVSGIMAVGISWLILMAIGAGITTLITGMTG
jgi:hypothetical protein